jgi:hypothetical protein
MKEVSYPEITSSTAIVRSERADDAILSPREKC